MLNFKIFFYIIFLVIMIYILSFFNYKKEHFSIENKFKNLSGCFRNSYYPLGNNKKTDDFFEYDDISNDIIINVLPIFYRKTFARICHQ